MEKSDDGPWMSAPAYGSSLKGFGVNLLVRDVPRTCDFLREVLGLDQAYADSDFAVLRHAGHDIILHADHTYGDHPLLALTSDSTIRGGGAELRLYGIDPDAAEARARARGDHVLAETSDKPHGLRECYIADPDGYIWVPGTALET
jgi:catechol 2,3-dioxygenase-like lactoylglutathione lyase family enzyme